MSTSDAPAPLVATANECASCGEPAELKCSKCSGGVDKDGHVSATHYCGKACQTKHWSFNEIECKLKQTRQRLWRAGELLRDLAYVHAHATWHHDVSVLRRNDRTIRLVFGSTHDAKYEYAIGRQHEFVTQKLYRVTLPGGEQFALTPTLAKYGGDESVLPWSDFARRYSNGLIDVRGLGYHTTKLDPDMAALLASSLSHAVLLPDTIACVMHYAHRQSANAAVETALAGEKLGNFMGMSALAYSKVKDPFLERFKTEVTENIERIKAYGGVNTVVARTLEFGAVILP
nr:hypothetical protein B0A51_00723 [Rachicladosporium sp. CCFEE 5018]